MEEFKLPKTGEKLFISGDYENKSYVGIKNPYDHMDMYAKGYKDSADMLVLDPINSRSNAIKDTRVYPIMFLYRHFIELRLKEIYLRFDENPNTKNLDHNLKVLWPKAKPLIEQANRQVDKTELNNTLSATQEYIEQFAEKDLNSFIYRYPFGKNKVATDKLTSYFGEELHIDLLHLKERIHELECLFYGTIVQLEEEERIKQEMLADFNNQ